VTEVIVRVWDREPELFEVLQVPNDAHGHPDPHQAYECELFEHLLSNIVAFESFAKTLPDAGGSFMSKVRLCRIEAYATMDRQFGQLLTDATEN